jgi:branched-chain amino acid transport system ATP-binding protein
VITRAYQHELNGSALSPGDTQLEASGLRLSFGGVIGPNGAGKTSLLNCISGLYRPQEGSIAFRRDPDQAPHELTRARPYRIARYGVARSFQNIELFRHLTVLQNLMLGRHVHMRHSVLPSLLWFGPARTQEVDHRELVEEVIDLLEIQAVRHKPVGALAYGIQKRVELGRALAMEPALLLLDEPMAGMNAEEKEDMARFILDVNELRHVTVVLIEHDMDVVMDISDHVTVLDFGQVIGDGTPAEVSGSQAVIDAYLGEQGATEGPGAGVAP